MPVIRGFCGLPCFWTNAGIVIAGKLLQQFRGFNCDHLIALS